MSNSPKILAFAGSTRTDSYNKKLVRVAAGGARKAGAEVTLVDLRDYPMPLFDEDMERQITLPENAVKLRELFISHDALLIAAPEYNGSLSAVLKNTIDWLSRRQEGDEGMVCFNGKIAAIMAASPGALGGMRMLMHLRVVLSGIQVLVLPNMRSVPKAHEVFYDDGQMKDENLSAAIEGIGRELAEVTLKLKG